MALDSWTVKAIKELSEKWSISKSEVMRRAVRQIKEKADKEEHTMDPLQALNWLQEDGGLVADEADQFRADLKAEREQRKFWWDS